MMTSVATLVAQSMNGIDQSLNWKNSSENVLDTRLKADKILFYRLCHKIIPQTIEIHCAL